MWNIYSARRFALALRLMFLGIITEYLVLVVENVVNGKGLYVENGDTICLCMYWPSSCVLVF
jgi:hypothetical protein